MTWLEFFSLKKKEKAKPVVVPVPLPEEDIFEEDEEDPEEDEKRHHFLIIWFSFLLENTLHRLGTLTDHLADEKITTQEWATIMREEMTGAHSEAFAIGRRLAGDAKAIGEGDLAGGIAAWKRQEEYFEKFVADLEAGRYTADDGSLKEKAFLARSRQYGEAIRGTVHDSFKTAMGTDVLRWILGDKVHCGPDASFRFNCPDLSLEDPKPADQWETAPGRGDTPCRNNCDCSWKSEDGRFSTEGI